MLYSSAAVAVETFVIHELSNMIWKEVKRYFVFRKSFGSAELVLHIKLFIPAASVRNK